LRVFSDMRLKPSFVNCLDNRDPQNPSLT
jgi:hypothetical protein